MVDGGPGGGGDGDGGGDGGVGPGGVGPGDGAGGIGVPVVNTLQIGVASCVKPAAVTFLLQSWSAAQCFVLSALSHWFNAVTLHQAK